ncbi:MAG TPA: acyltransferase, partial [Acidobacteriaceae bacterium]|nr:acyltransferase [Acidobacteriaceae bacterium]
MTASPPAASPPSALPEPHHKPELDGIRGIAILAVLLSHAAVHIRPDVHVARILIELMIPGWSGVELFFALSGFLITGILLRTKRSPNYFSSFYMRRFLRIFPIYYLTLTLGLIAAVFSPWWHSLMPELEKTRIAFYFYLQNCPLFWNHLQPLSGAFGHFWSLAVEEQFYLVWPILIWLLPEKTVFRICCAGFLLALPLRMLLFAKVFGSNFALMQLTTSRVDGLFIGSAF